MSKWEANGPCPRLLQADFDGSVIRSKTINGIFSQYLRLVAMRNQRLQPDWEDIVWTALHKSHPTYVKRVPGKGSPGVSVASAYAFVSFMAKRMFRRSLVAPEEAKRRASICKQCPMREPVLGCSICRDALAIAVKPPEQVDAPPACGACGCYLPLKVWIPRDQLGSEDAYDFWEKCWMRDQP